MLPVPARCRDRAPEHFQRMATALPVLWEAARLGRRGYHFGHRSHLGALESALRCSSNKTDARSFYSRCAGHSGDEKQTSFSKNAVIERLTEGKFQR